MPETPFDADRHLDAGLAALRLEMKSEWRPQVIAHLVAIARSADMVMAAKLGDDVEAAPVFEA